MKLKLIRCQICSDWFSPNRAHCPVCSATRIPINHTELIHINQAHESRPNIQVVSAISRYFFSDNAIAIANILYEKEA